MALLDPGQYEAEALDIQFGMTSTGKEQYVAMFKILSTDGRMLKTLQSYRVFEGNNPENTEKARSFRLRELKDLGFSWETMALPAKPIRVFVTVEIEDDQQGVPREKIQYINSATRAIAQKKPMGEGERLAFAARMRGYAAAQATPGDAKEPVGSELAVSKEPDPWETAGDKIPS